VHQVINQRRGIDLCGHAGLRKQGLDRRGDEQLVPDVGGEERVHAERIANAKADFLARIEEDEPECAPESWEDRFGGAEIGVQQQLGVAPVDTRLEVDPVGEVSAVVEHAAEDGAAATDFRDLSVRRLDELERRSPQACNPARVHGVW
jgi:hypothetical protein